VNCFLVALGEKELMVCQLETIAALLQISLLKYQLMLKG
jgi:hypothetical protein